MALFSFRVDVPRNASRGAAPTPRKPSRRLDPSFVPWCASKFHQPDTKLRFRRCPLSRTCHLTVTKSPLGLFKEISPKRNFFQRAPRRGSLSFHAAKRHENSLLLRFAEARRFRALRSATKGSAFGIRKPFEKGLSLNFILERASKFYVDITKIGQISADIT